MISQKFCFTAVIFKFSSDRFQHFSKHYLASYQIPFQYKQSTVQATRGHPSTLRVVNYLGFLFRGEWMSESEDWLRRGDVVWGRQFFCLFLLYNKNTARKTEEPEKKPQNIQLGCILILSCLILS